MKISIRIKLSIILIVCILGGIKVHAATSQPFNPILKIFYFKDNQKARTSLFKYSHSIDVLAPQAYAINKYGVLEGNIDSTILVFTQKNNIKVMPLVTNKSFSKDTANSILNDPTKQDNAINALVVEAEKQNYWGWQIDFEGMNALSKDLYSAFIKKAGGVLKQHNLILSVAVVAQISSNPSDYPNDLWNKVIGVYDYGPLASSADFISVMSYDDPDSIGPVAPYPWLKKVIEYSLQSIPANKLSLGIPLYYWKWNDTSGKLISVGGNVGIINTLKKRRVTAVYSSINEAPVLKYKVKKSHYSLWYENAKSMTKKIDLIKEYNLQGFSAWVLGLEVPNIYGALK